MANSGLTGLTVASFESRLAAEMTRLIERHGGKPLVAPALREVPLEDNSAALRFGEQLLAETLDVLILLTGVGTTTLFEILHSRHSTDEIKHALKDTVLIARGVSGLVCRVPIYRGLAELLIGPAATPPATGQGERLS